jgi:hypothetical protein
MGKVISMPVRRKKKKGFHTGRRILILFTGKKF